MTDDRTIGDYLGIGAVAASVIIIAGGAGFAVDEGLGTLPVFIFVGLVVGIAAASGFVWSRFRDSLRGPRNR